jgi:DEAD/DEAH box helicase domain-containing protein
MCDPRDLGQSLEDGALGADAASLDEADAGGEAFDPTLFLFDNVPGGIGLAARIHERAAELLAEVRVLLRGCPCEHGCPRCVGAVEPPSPVVGAAAALPRPLVLGRRQASLRLLERLMHDG